MYAHAYLYEQNPCPRPTLISNISLIQTLQTLGLGYALTSQAWLLGQQLLLGPAEGQARDAVGHYWSPGKCEGNVEAALGEVNDQGKTVVRDLWQLLLPRLGAGQDQLKRTDLPVQERQGMEMKPVEVCSVLAAMGLQIWKNMAQEILLGYISIQIIVIWTYFVTYLSTQ